ncbi:RNA polymerase sigma factor [Luteibacter anthropi]|uniref:RNA polymerase sigma factor n=1 Tax=Luteibacter anthropi TaxID=564369 RepID=UPI0020329E06|nr:RNA polymerase sigma factor [Luteibacter anthropi]URX62242.1 RNA polymerase sigma factor [Luteibacter anthropi]
MDAPLADDAALMQAWTGGDTAAFTTLYMRHKGALYRFLLRTLKDRALADELFQETWSRVIAARARYRPEARFSTWLLQIAHNLAIDSFRKQRPHAGQEETEAVFASQAAPEREQPEHALSDFELRRRMQLAMESLPDEQRTAFVLRMENELSIEEIATVTGVGRETAKSRLRYAMARIRELVAE